MSVFTYVFIYLSSYLSINVSLFISIYQSIYDCLFICIHLSICLSTCLSIPLSMPVCSYLSIFTNPSTRAGYDTRSFLNGVWQVWIQSFPSPRLVASPRLKNQVCPTILPIDGGRIIGFILFPRVLVLCEMQLAWSRFWTRVAVSISYDDNLSIYLSISVYHIYPSINLSYWLHWFYSGVPYAFHRFQ